MTENIPGTERIADYSPPDLPRPTTLDGWCKRAEMICTKGTKDIIEKTELEYFPFGEAARAIEVFKPWLTVGLNKALWVEGHHSGLKNCCIAHWNQCARLWDHIDSWEKAKEQFRPATVTGDRRTRQAHCSPRTCWTIIGIATCRRRPCRPRKKSRRPRKPGRSRQPSRPV